MRLPLGKLRNEVLKRDVLRYLGRRDARVVYGPRTGFDSAVLDNGDEYLIIATDPALDVPPETLGFFSYHFAVSDVTAFGADPAWLIVDVLLPPGSTEETLKEITSAIHRECLKYGGSVIGGHTGVYRALKEPVVTTTAIGSVSKDGLRVPVARPGDVIVVTDKVGLEVAVAASHARFEEVSRIVGREEAEKLREMYREETSVPDAMAARDFVRGMHDATEGGLTALHEIADNSNVGFRVFRERIPVRESVMRILRFYGIDPVTASSSGTLIAITPPENVETLVERLKAKGIRAEAIGAFTEDQRRILVENGEEREFPEFSEDPYVSVYVPE